MNYYNDIDAFCFDWLGNLMDAGEIACGEISSQDIRNVQPEQLSGFDQCHFFAGVGGWPLALRLAGWPTDAHVWTGSCPCQPLSCAGKGLGHADERHLWPAFFRLIRECRPATILGEQVSSKSGLEWLDGVFADLEDAGYACGAADLCAAGVGAPHNRQRLYWVAVAAQRGQRIDGGSSGDGGHAEQREQVGGVGDASTGGRTRGNRPGQQEQGPGARRDARGLADSERDGGRINEQEQGSEGGTIDRRFDSGNEGCPGLWRHKITPCDDLPRAAAGCNGQETHPGATLIPWPDARIVICRDIDKRTGTNALRRVSLEPGTFPLAARIPAKLGLELAGLEGMAKIARRNRVGRLRGYGNALCVPTAVQFIRAVMEILRA